VTSIGSQCCLEGLATYHFHNLGIDCSNLLDQLSRGKQANLPVKQVNRLFDSGILFLRSFLGSLDVAKMGR